MEKTKYLIGDVANLMGLSRDTLRYYEKRGLLNSHKGDNGYRYYTDQDISRLVSILYHRKMNISLEDMEHLWKDNTISQLPLIMSNRLKEEEEAIRKHEQTIARLRLTQSDCQRLNSHLNEVLCKDFPAAYIIVPETNMQESTGLWFQLTQSYPGLDMMYTYDEYSYRMPSGGLQMDYRNTQLILYKHLVEFVDYDIIDGATPVTKPAKCVYSFRAANTRIPDAGSLQPMFAWAKEQGIELSDRIYSTFAFQGVDNGQHLYYLEIYIPLA